MGQLEPYSETLSREIKIIIIKIKIVKRWSLYTQASKPGHLIHWAEARPFVQQASLL